MPARGDFSGSFPFMIFGASSMTTLETPYD
jgi:hypothetical protein